EEERAQAEAEVLRKALESEEAELVSAAEQRADDSEITGYIEALRTTVVSVFIYPPGLEDGLNCTLYVRMIPGGDVVEARVTQSSGNALFDRQAENAVRKAAPLPVPSNPRLFKRMRKIKFVFDP
ncbi:MAG: cell envelope integrity protein TolA, partial [Gammaproteobacteria bacterium]